MTTRGKKISVTSRVSLLGHQGLKGGGMGYSYVIPKNLTFSNIIMLL